MNFARPDLTERRLRACLRDSLVVWARFALAKRDMAPARHHLAIMAALERVERGETTRLLLLLPPGSAKSTYSSLVFPPWWFARHPTSAVITACHTAGLAEHFGRGVRDLIAEHGPRLGVRIRQDARAATRFLTGSGGQYFGVGIHGAVTGRRADLALIDDPIASFAEAETLSAREHLWNWFRSELLTRLKPGGRMVVIMTRWHVDDLAGRLISQGGWETLVLPAIAEANDPLGRQQGEALWPEWEDLPALHAKRDMLGERGFAAMFQQSPQPAAGRMFDLGKIRLVDETCPVMTVRAWDLAGTEGTEGCPDWTAGVKLSRQENGSFLVEDVLRFRASAGDVPGAVRRCAEADGRQVAIGLPQDPGQAGKAQVSFLAGLLAGFKVVASPETGSKRVRAMGVASQFCNGKIHLRRGAWNTEFLDELASFPHGRKDDQVDALSRAFNMMTAPENPARFAYLPHTTR